MCHLRALVHNTQFKECTMNLVFLCNTDKTVTFLFIAPFPSLVLNIFKTIYCLHQLCLHLVIRSLTSIRNLHSILFSTILQASFQGWPSNFVAHQNMKTIQLILKHILKVGFYFTTVQCHINTFFHPRATAYVLVKKNAL